MTAFDAVAYFRDAAGEVHAVRLPLSDARRACSNHPAEWSFSPDGHAPAPASVEVEPEPESAEIAE
jgi:hypothetical protein